MSSRVSGPGRCPWVLEWTGLPSPRLRIGHLEARPPLPGSSCFPNAVWRPRGWPLLALPRGFMLGVVEKGQVHTCPWGQAQGRRGPLGGRAD